MLSVLGYYKIILYKKHSHTCFAVCMCEFLLDVNLGVESLINRVCICWVLVNSTSVQNGCTKLHSHQQCHSSHCCMFVTFGIVSLFHFNPFSWMYSQMSLGFWLIFTWWPGKLNTFSYVYWPFGYPLLWSAYSNLLLIFKLCCLSFSYWLVRVLYVFWIWVLR